MIIIYCEVLEVKSSVDIIDFGLAPFNFVFAISIRMAGSQLVPRVHINHLYLRTFQSIFKTFLSLPVSEMVVSLEEFFLADINQSIDGSLTKTSMQAIKSFLDVLKQCKE